MGNKKIHEISYLNPLLRADAYISSNSTNPPMYGFPLNSIPTTHPSPILHFVSGENRFFLANKRARLSISRALSTPWARLQLKSTRAVIPLATYDSFPPYSKALITLCTYCSPLSITSELQNGSCGPYICHTTKLLRFQSLTNVSWGRSKF